MELFKSYLPVLENYLTDIATQPALDLKDASVDCNKGVYVLIENGKPIYVGRSNRMKKRLKEHIRGSYYSAHFAFNIAKSILTKKGIEITGSRKEMLLQADFKTEFDIAKNRVASMQLKYIRIEDEVLQALFEIYTAVEFNTIAKYNSFKTS